MILWQSSHGGQHYKVTRAGNSVRLYRNGIFHSQYNSRRLLNGGVWDMLWLPLFYRDADLTNQVLVLGVGGGAAIRKIMQYAQPERIVGVDCDNMHLRIAKKYFKVEPGVELFCADAIQWLARYSGKTFDLIIDDLFIDDDIDPDRAVSLYANDGKWLRQLTKHLSASGLAVINCGSTQEVKAASKKMAEINAGLDASRKTLFNHHYMLRVTGYDNAVLLLAAQPLEKKRCGLTCCVPQEAMPWHLRRSVLFAPTVFYRSAYT